MARDRDPFGLALQRLRLDLRDGRVRPGEPILTAELAASLRISVTPVREAVSRLVGEGLLEDHRGRGVHALRYDVDEVETLYSLHGAVVEQAGAIPRRLAEAEDAASESRTGADTFRDRTERFWMSRVRRGAGETMARRFQPLVDQLSILRLVEPRVLEGVAAEFDALEAAAVRGEGEELARAVRDYHRRRYDKARLLSSTLRQPGSGLNL